MGKVILCSLQNSKKSFEQFLQIFAIIISNMGKKNASSLAKKCKLLKINTIKFTSINLLLVQAGTIF